MTSFWWMTTPPTSSHDPSSLAHHAQGQLSNLSALHSLSAFSTHCTFYLKYSFFLSPNPLRSQLRNFFFKELLDCAKRSAWTQPWLWEQAWLVRPGSHVFPSLLFIPGKPCLAFHSSIFPSAEKQIKILYSIRWEFSQLQTSGNPK